MPLPVPVVTYTSIHSPGDLHGDQLLQGQSDVYNTPGPFLPHDGKTHSESVRNLNQSLDVCVPEQSKSDSEAPGSQIVVSEPELRKSTRVKKQPAYLKDFVF